MRYMFEQWYKRYFSNEESIYLVIYVVLSFAVLFFLGHLLTPLFVALILAYLMQGGVVSLKQRNMPHIAAVAVVYAVFIGIVLAIMFVLLPLAWSQLLRFVEEQLPELLSRSQEVSTSLSVKYPNYFSEAQAAAISLGLKARVAEWGQKLLSLSINGLPNLIGIMIFVVLVPVLVFFFLKDRDYLVGGVLKMLPARRPIINQVWVEMNRQMANYVRGKAFEIIIVGSVTFICFTFLKLKYAALLSLMVGLSVLIPFIGAAVATVPVAIVAYFQMGWGSDFITVIVVYSIIQAIDGNILVPLLFSEAVNLHPVAIILAVLVFGGLWGVWGVFFAIPLATLVKALWVSWPTHGAA